MNRSRLLIPLLTLALVLVIAGGAWACPNCAEAIANDAASEGAHTRDGFFWSILLMIAMPFLLLSTGAAMLVRAVKRGMIPEL